MAKMFATEAAQRVIDRAVQLHGGLGVTKGVAVEKLYREIRALRIYEGATEVQKVVNMIKGDKAKLDTYCQIVKLGEQAMAAAEKKDQKKMEDLNKQADALGAKLGPDYVKLMGSMEEVDPESKDGKDLIAIFDSLDQTCPK